MAQATYVPNIAHDKAAALAFFNAVFQAIATNNSGATAPSETFPGMWWLDTSTTPPTLRQRNQGNSAWIVFQPPSLTEAQATDSGNDVVGLVSGQVLSQAVAAFAPRQVYDYQEFLASGTWTKPANALPTDRVFVHVVAGGDGGGYIGTSGGTGAISGSSGGLGGYYEYTMDELPASCPVTVGLGGAAITSSATTTTSGNQGGASQFGANGTVPRLRCENGGQSVPTIIVPTSGGAVSIDLPFPSRALGSSSSEWGGGGSGQGTPTQGNRRPGGSLRAGRGGHGGDNNALAEDGQFPGGAGGSVRRTSGTRTSGKGADGVVRVSCIRD